LPNNLLYKNLDASRPTTLKIFYKPTSDEDMNEMLSDDSEQLLLTLIDLALRNIMITT